MQEELHEGHERKLEREGDHGREEGWEYKQEHGGEGEPERDQREHEHEHERKDGHDTHVKKVNTTKEEDRTRHFAINYEHSKKSMKVYAVN
jgi:hypothetical protein